MVNFIKLKLSMLAFLLSLNAFAQIIFESDFANAAQTPSNNNLLYKADIKYVGAFKVPEFTFREPRFSWGGTAPAFNPNNPSDLTDDTLFLVGHAHHQETAEITIPTLVNSSNVNDLNVAVLVQAFADVSDGLLEQNLPTRTGVRIGGMLVDGNNLIWSGYKFYDASGSAKYSHGLSGLDLSIPNDARGMYRLTDPNPGYTGGYMTHIPKEWQSALGGRVLTGLAGVSIVSRTSAGPSAFVFNPEDLGNKSPVPATGLVYYPLDKPLGGGMRTENKYFNLNSGVRGVVFPEGSNSILFFGSHATGGVCYGTAKECGSTGYKGFHPLNGERILQVWAYDVKDFIEVKNKNKKPWELMPYAVWNMNFPIVNQRSGIAGVTYDPITSRIFIVQPRADNNRPIIHVYEVQASGFARPKPPVWSNP